MDPWIYLKLLKGINTDRTSTNKHKGRYKNETNKHHINPGSLNSSKFDLLVTSFINLYLRFSVFSASLQHEFNKSIHLYSWITGLPFTFTSRKMVSDNGVGGGGWMGVGDEFYVFFIYINRQKYRIFYFPGKVIFCAFMRNIE